MPSAAGLYYSYSDSGYKEQPPVILIHDVGQDYLSWPLAVRRLAGQRVYAVDLPGHGKSGGFGLQSISSYADLMVEFLASLGQYQAVFIGHGMGGAIALEMAIQHPVHTAGLGLISTGAYVGVNPQMLESFSNPLTLENALYSYQQKAFCQSTPPAVVDQCLKSMRNTRSSVLAADWAAVSQFDQRERVHQITAPAWVIVGAKDKLTPVNYAHFLAGSIPAARLQIIAEAGHMVMLEQPNAVVHGLQQFFSALSAVRRVNALPAGLVDSRPQPFSPSLSTTARTGKNHES